MDWQRVEALLSDWMTPMPHAGTVVWVVTALALTFFAFAAWRGWLHGVRGVLWLALGATVSGIVIATLAFRIGDAPPAGVEATNFYGNIVLFIPLGLVLAFLFDGRLVGRVAAAAVAGAVLSGGIELTQTTMDRVADINDVILNSSGAALGACLGCGVLIVSRTRKTAKRGGIAAAPDASVEGSLDRIGYVRDRVGD